MAVVSEIQSLEERQDARQAEISRAQRAQRILDDELFVEAVEAVKQHVWDKFTGADPEDVEALKMVRLKLACLNEVLQELRTHTQTGLLAEHEMKGILDKLKFLKGR